MYVRLNWVWREGTPFEGAGEHLRRKPSLQLPHCWPRELFELWLYHRVSRSCIKIFVNFIILLGGRSITYRAIRQGFMQPKKEWGKVIIPLSVRAENDGIIRSLACKSAGAIVKSVAISPWTSLFENGWIKRGPACCWVSKLPDAAVLVKPKGLTCAFACNDSPSFSTFITHNLKFFWATYLKGFGHYVAE